MIKLIIVVLYLIIFGIISIPAQIYISIVGKKSPLKAAAFAQKIVKRGFRGVFFLVGIKVKCIGVENVPKDRPVLFAANHRGFADIASAYATLPVTTGFVAKKEMKKAPIISTWLNNMRGVYIDRENPKEGLKAILEAIDNVNNGFSMFILPEGTRSHTEEMLPFKKGSLKIAEKTKCPIVPVAFTNTDDVFENHFPRVKGTNITIQYGKPIEVKDLSREEMKDLTETVQLKVKEMLDKNKDK